MSDSFENVATSAKRLVGVRQVDSFGLPPQATFPSVGMIGGWTIADDSFDSRAVVALRPSSVAQDAPGLG